MPVRDIATKAYRAACKAMDEGDYDMARAALRWARRADGGNALFIHAEAELERRVGNHYEAERLYRRLTDFAERSFGVGHINNVGLAGRMIGLYEEMGRTHQANLLRHRTIGEIDRDTAADGSIHALERFATICIDAGRAAEAVAVYESALRRRRAVFGEGHAKVTECLTALSALRSKIAAEPTAARGRPARLGPEIIWRREDEAGAALSA